MRWLPYSTGSHGVDLTKSYEYKIYVKKPDYKEAMVLLNGIKSIRIFDYGIKY